MPSRPSLFISLPAAGALLLTTYLYNAPLSRSKTRTIHISENPTSSTLSSHSLNSIVNPRHHKLITDSRSIILSKAEIKNLSDEEILARFLKGFFGGWIFTPEITLIATLRGMGLPFIPAGYSCTLLYHPRPLYRPDTKIIHSCKANWTNPPISIPALTDNFTPATHPPFRWELHGLRCQYQVSRYIK
jgi:hypothetical protein